MEMRRLHCYASLIQRDASKTVVPAALNLIIEKKNSDQKEHSIPQKVFFPSTRSLNGLTIILKNYRVLFRRSTVKKV